MSFQPVIPVSGYAGWTFLKRTQDSQEAAFTAAPRLVRDTDYFRQKIGDIKTAEDLVADRRLLSVALGAFGLDSDINNRFFLKKILQDGTLEPSALGNRLADKRYLAFSKAFGFGDFSTPRTVLSTFPDEIISAFNERQFEIAVGERDGDLRLAMGLGRELGKIAERSTTADGRWFAVMGNPPLRQVMEKALGLPSSFGRLDLDLQLDGFRRAAQRSLGVSEVADLASPAMQERMIQLFLARSQIQTAATGGGQAALALLQSARR